MITGHPSVPTFVRRRLELAPRFLSACQLWAQLSRDVCYGWRQTKRNKTAAVTIIFLLGVGVGANTVVFGFIDDLILKPLPIRDPKSLFLIEKMPPEAIRPVTSCTYRAYEDIRARTDLFSAAVAFQEWAEDSFQPLDAGTLTKLISIQMVSPNYFSQLDVKPTLGRSLTPSDAALTSGVPVLVSEHFWKSQLNGGRDVLRRSLRIKNYPFAIVGVVPKSFHGLDIDRVPDIWAPISAARILTGHAVYETISDPEGLRFAVLVRLTPNTRPAAAAAAILRSIRESDAAVVRAYFSDLERTSAGQRSSVATQSQISDAVRGATDYRIVLARVTTGLSRMRSQFSAAIYTVMAAAALLLLAVCTSVSGILRAQTEQRSREFAVRAAVGAQPGQLVRQVIIETLLYTVPAAGLAVLVFYTAAPLLVHLLPQVRGILPFHATPQALDLALDGRLIAFIAAVCSLTIFFSSLGAARRCADVDIAGNISQLRESKRGARFDVRMLSIQAGISVALVAGAIFMMKTFWTLRHLNPGFDRVHVLEVDVDPIAAGYSSERTGAFLGELTNEVAFIPGVRSVARASTGVMHQIGLKTIMVPEGKVLPETAALNTTIEIITPAYFRTLGIPLLAGRTFESSDANSNPSPVVVNKAFADAFFPNEDPIAKGIVGGRDGKRAPPRYVVVGVVGTAKFRSLREENPPILYGVTDDHASDARILYIHTFGNPTPLIAHISKLIRSHDPHVPIVATASLEQEVEGTLWQERLLALLSGFFAVIALALASAGMYGALAHSVSARTREIGIRMALGAKSRDIIRTVCSRLFGAVAIGVLFGTVAATILMREARQLFYGVERFDVPGFLVAVGCILVCEIAAATVPGYRATKTDPVAAIRAQ